MEQLAILEKICNNLFDSLECGTPIYIFAGAIYDTWWYKGTDLERNLAKRLVSLWEPELEARMCEAYKKTKYDEKRLEQDEYYMKWIENNYILYSDNHGIRSALINIWEKKKYRFRHWDVLNN
jgi:hypothetical protein